MKKRILAALLAASMALCAGCGSQTSDDGEEQTAAGTAVEVAEVTKGAMSTEYSVNGKVVADNEVQVFPMLAGQVLTLSVSEGDKVAKGQTLLNVDTSSVTSTMSSLRESYNATKTATEKAIENAQIGVEQAQLAVENTEALLEAGAAAEQDLTKAKQAGATMIFAPIYYTPASVLLKNAKDMGYDVKMMGCDGMDGILAIEGFDTSLAEGLMMLTPFAADAKDEKTVSFVTKYQEKFGGVPNQFAADAYDGIYALAAACEKAGIALL
mgnify:CR=1 FL=1